MAMDYGDGYAALALAEDHANARWHRAWDRNGGPGGRAEAEAFADWHHAVGALAHIEYNGFGVCRAHIAIDGRKQPA